MRPAEVFKFCPRCAAPRLPENVGQSPLRCAACGFTYYFGPTVAAAAFVSRPDGRVLFIRRAKDPSAGKLGVPGGFIDFGESAEEGMRREVREEVGLEIERPRFVMSFPNTYLYRDVTYLVVDLSFTADAINPETAQSLDGVAGIEWRFLRDVADEELAFDSMRVTVAVLRAGIA